MSATDGSGNAPVGGGQGTISGGGAGTSPVSGTSYGLTPYGSFAPSGVGGGGGGVGFGTLPTRVTTIEEIPPPITLLKTPPTRVAFTRPKMTLSNATGVVDVPKGTRIAGREASAKINLKHLLATDTERISFAWMCDQGIPFDFETVLLGGRIGLNFAEVPFFTNEKLRLSEHQAMRFYEQANGKLNLEKDTLTNYGYEVIDLSGVAVLNNVDNVLGLVMELKDTLAGRDYSLMQEI